MRQCRDGIKSPTFWHTHTRRGDATDPSSAGLGLIHRTSTDKVLLRTRQACAAASLRLYSSQPGSPTQFRSTQTPSSLSAYCTSREGSGGKILLRMLNSPVAHVCSVGLPCTASAKVHMATSGESRRPWNSKRLAGGKKRATSAPTNRAG